MNEFSQSQITNEEYRIYDKWNQEEMLLRNQLGGPVVADNPHENQDQEGPTEKKELADGRSRYEMGQKK